jgi:hypothetical protein
MRHRSIALLIVCTAPAACQPDSMEEPASAGEIEEVVQPAVYGTDDRLDYHEYPSEVARQYANGVGMTVSQTFLAPAPFGHTQLTTRPYLDSVLYCPEVKFRGQPEALGGHCTVFAVAPDLVATAKHCYPTAGELGDHKVVFGFRSKAPSSYATSVLTSLNVFSVVEHIPIPWNDTLLLRVDRLIPPMRILPTRRVHRPALFTQLWGLSHPETIPLKYHSGAAVATVSSSTLSFQHWLDVFHGSSGAPIIDKNSNLVEGVVSSGREDFAFDEANGCYRYATYTHGPGSFESAADTVAFYEYLPRQSRVATGDHHTCNVNGDRTVSCWGSNVRGQLGNGTNTDSLTPVRVSNLTDVIDISAGGAYTCARRGDLTVWCWGYNFSGQLGDGSWAERWLPTQIPGLKAASISAGSSHACGLGVTGTVSCWGDNSFGTLGDGTTTHRSSPVTPSGLGAAISVSAGSSHTCAVLRDRTARCWGTNSVGELGTGSTSTSYTLVPVTVQG